MPATRLKVCCIASDEEAALAARYGAAALGLVSSMPSGPGVIPDERIAEIAARVPPGVARFLLTSRTDTEAIVAQQRRCGVDTLQLCDRIAGGVHEQLRERLPGVRIVQVVHVVGPESVPEAERAARTADALLLDSGRPDAQRPELGGTGRTHDWGVSRRIRDAVGIPVYLAGGLDAANVGAAVSAVQPFGVDVCSGLRRDGRLDEALLATFAAALVAAG